MSKVKVNGNHGFVGTPSGPAWLAEHDEYDSDHPLVKAHPEMFDKVVETAPVKGKAKAADD